LHSPKRLKGKKRDRSIKTTNKTV